VRLAIPRRVYTQSHIEYVVEVILDVWRRRDAIPGYDVVHQAPFSAAFQRAPETPEHSSIEVSIDPGLKKKCPSVALDASPLTCARLIHRWNFLANWILCERAF